MSRYKPCWSCFSDGPCFEPCECRKCVDPEGYARWREERPDQHMQWWARQQEDPDEYDRLMKEAQHIQEDMRAGWR